ncbi:hypothetical protein BH23ACT5_BH23ACT5_12040 [soil metagenome]
MAVVRLFARLREMAGSSRLSVEGSTVGEVVDAVGEQVGPGFAEAVVTARIWRNGEEAERSDPVDDDDEIALLPPVSGGAATVQSIPQVTALVPLVAAAALVILNARGDDAWWAAVVVGVAGAWVVDVAAQMDVRVRPFPALGVLFGVVAGVALPHTMGVVGMSVAVAFAVIVVLAWGVGFEGHRSVDSLAPGVMVAILVAAAAASLILARSAVSPDPRATDVFLLAVIVATVAGLAVDRIAALPFLDPFTVTAITAILASVAASFFWELDVAGYLLVGLGIAITLVAGRGLGSLLRAGNVSLTDPAPGFLGSFDGPLLAAALYFPLVRLVL